MKRYQSGVWAPRGYYLNKETWEIQALPRRGGVLRGAGDSTYIRLPVHPALMPFLGPVLGGLYVVLIPLVGIPILLWFLSVRMWKKLAAAMARLVNGRREA